MGSAGTRRILCWGGLAAACFAISEAGRKVQWIERQGRDWGGGTNHKPDHPGGGEVFSEGLWSEMRFGVIGLDADLIVLLRVQLRLTTAVGQWRMRPQRPANIRMAEGAILDGPSCNTVDVSSESANARWPG